MKRISSPKTWPSRLKILIALKEDPEIISLISMKEFNNFSADDLAKSWSLVEFLLEVYPQQFLQFIKTFPKGEKSMVYLEKMLKISSKELNEEWKIWARARY